MGSGFSSPWINIYRDSTEVKWTYRFVWWPRRSDQSGQRIWFTRAWCGSRLAWRFNNEDPVKIEQWLTEEEYIWYWLTNA
jgi:hypothetical protein